MAKTAFIPVSSCSVFILAFIDSSAIQNGSGQGLYFVDNRSSTGSQNEGTAFLNTACTKMSNIAWYLVPLNPNDGFTYSIQSIGSSNAWGDGGQPVATANGYYTGQAQNQGQAQYSLEINAMGTANYQPATTLYASVQ